MGALSHIPQTVLNQIEKLYLAGEYDLVYSLEEFGWAVMRNPKKWGIQVEEETHSNPVPTQQ